MSSCRPCGRPTATARRRRRRPSPQRAAPARHCVDRQAPRPPAEPPDRYDRRGEAPSGRPTRLLTISLPRRTVGTGPREGVVMTGAQPPPQTGGSLLVVSAHAGDFVWRAAGAIALAAERGERATVV